MSTLKVNTLEEATSGGATFFTDKAWISMNGKGTVAIRNDGNVSSLTDNGTGDYTANFSNTLSTSNHGMSCCIACYQPSDPGSADIRLRSSSGSYGDNPLLSSSSVRVEVGTNGGANYDYGYASWSVTI